MGIISPRETKAIVKVMDAADARSGSKVLEIGCGRGEASIMIAKMYGCEVTGVDKSRNKIAEAAGNTKWGGGPAFALEDFDSETSEDETVFISEYYDIILSECTLSLSRDRRKLIAKIARSLAPGGRLIVIDVCGMNDGHCDTSELAAEAEAAGLKKICEEDLSGELTDWAIEKIWEFGSMDEYFKSVTPCGERADDYGSAFARACGSGEAAPGYALTMFAKA